MIQKQGLCYSENLLGEISEEISFQLPESRDTADLKGQLRETLPLGALSESQVIRHFTRLSTWNYHIDAGTYPLGSCTMKHNPRRNERVAGFSGFTEIHPMIGAAGSQGIMQILYETESWLKALTGMSAVSFQPSAGAHGELLGMLLIHAFHRKNGEKRSKVLIPDSAHGTNPASAAFCGYTPVEVPSGLNGVLEPETVAGYLDNEVAGMMITNPNTLGLFETHIREICSMVHQAGGLVYGDGANMNALLGRFRPADWGIDVLHLNLHKTFSTPHGGGGPGSGPVCVVPELEPFLPLPRVQKEAGKYTFLETRADSIGRIHGFHGNVGTVVRALAYLMSQGEAGLREVSGRAVLHARYIRESLRTDFDVPYQNPCLHECVFSGKKQEPFGVSTMDMAKRMMDYGLHPPTIYFPLVVPGALMIEPTETESPEDIERLIEIFRHIAREAVESPGVFASAPSHAPRSRVDEVAAARHPLLKQEKSTTGV